MTSLNPNRHRLILTAPYADGPDWGEIVTMQRLAPCRSFISLEYPDLRIRWADAKSAPKAFAIPSVGDQFTTEHGAIIEAARVFWQESGEPLIIATNGHNYPLASLRPVQPATAALELGGWDESMKAVIAAHEALRAAQAALDAAIYNHQRVTAQLRKDQQS